MCPRCDALRAVPDHLTLDHRPFQMVQAIHFLTVYLFSVVGASNATVNQLVAHHTLPFYKAIICTLRTKTKSKMRENKG